MAEELKPNEPQPGTREAIVLAEFRKGRPLSMNNACKLLNIDEKQFTNAIDGLRLLGWNILPLGGSTWELRPGLYKGLAPRRV